MVLLARLVGAAVALVIFSILRGAVLLEGPGAAGWRQLLNFVLLMISLTVGALAGEHALRLLRRGRSRR